MVDLKDVPSMGIGSNAIAALHKDVFYGRRRGCQGNLVQRTKKPWDAKMMMLVRSKSNGLARLDPVRLLVSGQN